jgi:hypothetical protein
MPNFSTAREACSEEFDRASMMPSITVCSTSAYRRIRVRPIHCSHDCSWVGETSLRAVSRSCALATRVASGIRRIPRRAANSYEDAAQVGRAPVAFADIAAFENFGFAGGRSSSPSQTMRRPALLVWCSFGHHSLAYTARCSPETGKPASRGYHPGSIPCGFVADDPCSPGRFRRVS